MIVTFLLAASTADAPGQDAEGVQASSNAQDFAGNYFIDQQQSEGASTSVDLERIEPPRSPYAAGNGTPIFFPEVVRIEFTTNGGAAEFCSGVAIADNRILTAGHCGCGIQASYLVQFRAWTTGTPYGPVGLGQKNQISREPVTFPGYDCSQSEIAQPGRDLAILYLEKPVAHVLPPPVAPMGLTFAGDRAKRVLLTGYGKTERGTFPGGLLGALSPLHDYFCASGNSLGSTCAMFREFVLADRVSAASARVDTCDGDSGGPVYWFTKIEKADGTKSIERFLIGVTSRGVAEGQQKYGTSDCGGGGIYTAIGHVDVLAWMSLNGAPMDVGLQARHFALMTKDTFDLIFDR